MSTLHTLRTTCLILGLAALPASAAEIDFTRLLNAHTSPQDWLMHHGSYRSWHYSALEQINTNNVSGLRVAWLHTPAASPGGVQSFPLVADGVLYYVSGAEEVWALDAATGNKLWRYRHEALGAPLEARGLALGHGKVFVSAGAEIIALDMARGVAVWNKRLIDSGKSKARLGIPLLVKDKIIVASNAGGMAECCGSIYAVLAANGAKAWQFDSLGGDDAARATWNGDSWKTGGGGTWQAGSYDHASNKVWFGIAGPTPRHDWAGDQWRSDGARPGTNLYTASVIALDADSGKLTSYFQEIPHDVWGFDAAAGEHMLFERDGKRYTLHPNGSGHVFVYRRDGAAALERVGLDAAEPLPGAVTLELANVWRLTKYSNFVHSIDTRTGTLIGRRELQLGKHLNVCPSSDGAIGFATGALNPRTGMYYKATREWCNNIELAQLANADEGEPPQISATWHAAAPPGRPAFGHVSGRDPISGAVMWEREYALPPSGSLLTTAGELLFVPHAGGMLEALDARDGRTLWTHNNGLAHQGGAISYAVNGKQYVAVVTGWGNDAAASYARLWGDPFASMPSNAGQLIVFALP